MAFFILIQLSIIQSSITYTLTPTLSHHTDGYSTQILSKLLLVLSATSSHSIICLEKLLIHDGLDAFIMLFCSGWKWRAASQRLQQALHHRLERLLNDGNDARIQLINHFWCQYGLFKINIEFGDEIQSNRSAPFLRIAHFWFHNYWDHFIVGFYMCSIIKLQLTIVSCIVACNLFHIPFCNKNDDTFTVKDAFFHLFSHCTFNFFLVEPSN
mmetsp:Transcript_8094/g.11366  ORF Transcript_8094/g.11366 Transcript_8094/m.11366 type:complete len:212 (+) Transcript_8094:1499-2134(+)